MKRMKLGELGAKLPIGILNGKSLVKEFALRPYKSRIDRHLGDWQETASAQYTPGQLLAYKVAKFISLIVSEAGGKAIALTEDGNSTPEQELAIHGWHYVDVMYAYILARIASLGSTLDVTATCSASKCTWKGDARFDLKQMDVDVLEDADAADRWITLKRPLKLRVGKTARKLRILPATYAAVIAPGFMSGNRGSLMYAGILDAVRGVDCVEGPYVLTPPELDELERADMVMINRAGGELLVGADLTTTVECPKCKNQITSALNWQHDHFFGISLPDGETPTPSTSTSTPSPD